MTTTTQLEDDLTRALGVIREHWAALLPTTVPAAGVGAGGGGSKRSVAAEYDDPTDGDIPLIDRRVSLRHEVTLNLNGWARIIVEDRDTQHGIPDGGDTLGLVTFLIRHAQWFSGHEAAQDAVDEISGYARRVRAAAVPVRRDWMPIGDCPREVPDADGNHVTCGGRVRAYPPKEDDRAKVKFIVCPSCGYEDTLAWWMSQIVPEGADLAPADTVIACVVSRTFQPLTHAQLRQWAARGFVQRHGKDVKGRTLYSSKAVLAYAQHKTSEEAA